MAPVHDLLEYYLSLAKVQDASLLSFSQRKIIIVLMLHDFFSEHISMIDVCSIAQYLTFEPDSMNAEETDLEYMIWCCSELIPTEDQHRIYDQPQTSQIELLAKLKQYVAAEIESITSIILDRSSQKLVA